jgi:hypothetical protein
LYFLPQHSHIIEFGVLGGAKGISECDDNSGAGSITGAGAAEIEIFLICLIEMKCFSICFLLHV